MARSGDLATTEEPLFGAGLLTPPTAGPQVSRGEGSEALLFGAGLQTPPTAASETFDRPSGNVGRPRRNFRERLNASSLTSPVAASGAARPAPVR